jgi:hypothetical protein
VGLVKIVVGYNVMMVFWEMAMDALLLAKFQQAINVQEEHVTHLIRALKYVEMGSIFTIINVMMVI